MASWFKSISVMACGCVMLSACSKDAEEPSTDTVAVVAGKYITTPDVLAEMEHRADQGLVRLSAREVAEGLIRREAMLARARTSELMSDPAVRRVVERALLDQLREKELVPLRENIAVSEEALRALYAESAEQYTKPALNRVAMIEIKRPKVMSEAKALEVKARANEALSRVSTLPADEPLTLAKGFGALARTHNDHQLSKNRGGDLGWIAGDRPPSYLPPAVFDMALRTPVGVPSEVLELEQGYYIVMRTGHRAERVASFDSVKSGLRARYLTEARGQADAAYYATVLEESGTLRFDDRLNALDAMNFEMNVEEQRRVARFPTP